MGHTLRLSGYKDSISLPKKKIGREDSLYIVKYVSPLFFMSPPSPFPSPSPSYVDEEAAWAAGASPTGGVQGVGYTLADDADDPCAYPGLTDLQNILANGHGYVPGDQGEVPLPQFTGTRRVFDPSSSSDRNDRDTDNSSQDTHVEDYDNVVYEQEQEQEHDENATTKATKRARGDQTGLTGEGKKPSRPNRCDHLRGHWAGDADHNPDPPPHPLVRGIATITPTTDTNTISVAGKISSPFPSPPPNLLARGPLLTHQIDEPPPLRTVTATSTGPGPTRVHLEPGCMGTAPPATSEEDDDHQPQPHHQQHRHRHRHRPRDPLGREMGDREPLPGTVRGDLGDVPLPMYLGRRVYFPDSDEDANDDKDRRPRVPVEGQHQHAGQVEVSPTPMGGTGGDRGFACDPSRPKEGLPGPPCPPTVRGRIMGGVGTVVGVGTFASSFSSEDWDEARVGEEGEEVGDGEEGEGQEDEHEEEGEEEQEEEQEEEEEEARVGDPEQDDIFMEKKKESGPVLRRSNRLRRRESL